MNAQNNNKDHPVLGELRGKSLTDLSGLTREQVQRLLNKKQPIPLSIKIGRKTLKFHGLDVPAYLLWQREHADRTERHIDDECSWALLSGSSIGISNTGRLIPVLYWHSAFGQLGAYANKPGDQCDDDLSVRPSAVFTSAS